MPSTPSGYVLPPEYYAVPGTTIRSTQHNSPLEDLAQGVNDSLARDGTRPMTGNLPMNGRKITGLGAASAPSDAPRFDQVIPLSGFLGAVSALALTADQIPYSTSGGGAAATGLTAFARTLLDDSDQQTAKSTLGVNRLAQDITETRLLSNDASRYLFVRGDGSGWGAINAGALPVSSGGTGGTTAQAARNGIQAPATPNSAPFVAISANSTYTLPSGGRWAWFFVNVQFNNPVGAHAGVSNGGTTIYNSPPHNCMGFAWRVQE